MFCSSIPISETIKIMELHLEKKKTNQIIKNEILKLLKICLNQNNFQFQKLYYADISGLIMGNSLSLLLAEIFMDNLEDMIT